MERTVEALWKRRAGAFWRESAPYFRDMGQSGLPFVISMLLLTGMAAYVSLLREVPAEFPFTLVGMAALTPVIAYSPLRTWLREADIVFLLPREGEMGRYLNRSFRYNGFAGLLAAAAVCLLYLPLYSYGPGQLAGPLVLAAVLLLKAANAAGAWQERRLVRDGTRRGMRLLRWTATAVGIAALLRTAPWKAALFLAAAGALFALLYGKLPSFRLPWMTLIREEARTKRRYTVFFSAFADVPSETAQVASRSYLTWIARWIGYKQPDAYAFLYAHTLMRTELGGIALRLTVFGMVAGALAAEAGLWAGWGAAGVYLLFVWLTGLQLGALTQAHRHSVWRHVYPLPDNQRLAAVLRIDRIAALLCALALAVPQAVWLPGQGLMLPSAAGIAIAAGYIVLIRPAGLKRKFAHDTEDDE